MDDLLALYVHNGCGFFYDLNCNVISIFKSSICQNSVVIRLRVLRVIVNLGTFQSFPLSKLNFSFNIFIFSSMMTSNILDKRYFKPKKNVKFLSSTAVIITIGPSNFPTLMEFLSASALGKVMGKAAGYGNTNFEPGSSRQPSDSQIEPNIEKLEGPIVMITAVIAATRGVHYF